jgi:hypothetical protein
LLQQVYPQWYMLYQNNVHWHGEAAQALEAVALAVGDHSSAAVSALAVEVAHTADSLALPG